MKPLPKYPSLYQINTRVWLTELSQRLGKHATLDDIPDHSLDEIQQLGFDWVWLLSVWKTGNKGRKVSLESKHWHGEFGETLPDLKDEDIGGSGFAIADYHVDRRIGGDKALARFRDKLSKRGIRLMLDFVPNHMGPDHPWVHSYPEYFVGGTEKDLHEQHYNYTRIRVPEGSRILAYGRDPYFDGWPDTFQLDYSNPETVNAMQQKLLRIAGQCDGVRCDMAMLVLPDIFERTWGRRAQNFWPVATKAVKKKYPDFCFMAEVYWDLEWEMQQQGFNYAYDKRLYDRLAEGNPLHVREHLYAGLDYQDKLARFLENHDEPRAAYTFTNEKHMAAAIITFLSPGLRFFHQGQLQGKKVRISPHLIRGPHEPVDPVMEDFYLRLLHLLKNEAFRQGSWRLLHCIPAWEGNHSWESFIVFYWTGEEEACYLVVVNFAPHGSQCYVRVPIGQEHNKIVRIKDLMSTAVYDRNPSDMRSSGLFLDLPSWGFNVFELEP